MIRYLLAASILVTFVTFPMHGQGTLVILLDSYQNPTEHDPALDQRMLAQTQQIVVAHNDPVFSHYCDPFNSDYHAVGQEGVIEQLDSVSSGEIPAPQMQTNWQQMGYGIIEKLIKQEKRLDMSTVAIHLITASDNMSDFELNFVSPFAHVFNLLDDNGNLSQSFSVTIHSHSSDWTSPKVTQITALK